MALTKIMIGSLEMISSTGSPTAGGDPSIDTQTPFSVINAGWTPQAAKPLSIWGGGPPFTSGRVLAYQSYDDVTEQIPIGILASSHDNAAALLQRLRQELSQANATYPTLLTIKPNGATNTMYSQIKSAHVQETTELLNPAAGFTDIRAVITWVRSPFFGMTGPTGETVINAQTINNSYSGSPDNRVNFTVGSGDLIYEGQPLNLTLTNATGSTLANQVLYLGTIGNMTLDVSTQSVTTSSTTGASAGTGDTIDVGTVLDATQSLKMRVIAQLSSLTGAADMRLKCYVSSSAPAPFYIGPWYFPQTSGDRYDGGTVPSNLFKSTGLSTMYVVLEVRSRTGGSVTVTLSGINIVYYYTLCKISGLDSIPNSTGVVHVRGFVATSGRALLPLRRAEAYVLNSGNQTYYGRVDGVAPVYIANGLLWLQVVSASGTPPASATFTATAIQAPLWRTLRGAD